MNLSLLHSGLFSVVLLASGLHCCAAADPSIHISFLTTGKNIIPLICRYQSLVLTDVKLPDIVITNPLPIPVTPVEVEIIGKSAGAPLYTQRILRPALAAMLTAVNAQLKRILTQTSASHESLGFAFGDVQIHGPSLAQGATIPPGHSAVILLSQVRHLQFAGDEKIDRLQLLLACESEHGRLTTALDVPLMFWETTNRYSFPIRGSVRVESMALNYQGHRRAHSQEFAIDIFQVRAGRLGRITTSRKSGSARLKDYYIYRQPVLAAADGTVVEIADAYPEHQTTSPRAWSAEAAAEVLKPLKQTIGLRNSFGGNYIVLRHGPNEFSYYAHLSQHSMKVRLGDQVKAGQPIALVGSTGNSSEPHLHFHLMDASDVLAANGLPLTFSDVPPTAINQYFTQANSLPLSDCLYLFLPPANH